MIYSLAERGKTVFITTHYMEEAEYCDRIALIDQGKLIAQGSPDQLKREALSGRIYEMETLDVLAAADILTRSDKVFEAAVFGRSLHVRCEAMDNAEEYLAAQLKQGNQEIQNFRLIEPTLEDVFVALVGRKLEDN